MAITLISEEEIKNAQVQGNLPDRPTQNSLYPENTLSAEEVKAAFDKLPKLIAARYNELVRTILGVNNGELSADSLAGLIKTGIRENHTLKDLFNDILRGDLASGDKLPIVSTEDNGKLMTVKNGEWVAADLQLKESIPYLFSSSSGTIDSDNYKKIIADKIYCFLPYKGSLVLLSPHGLTADSSKYSMHGSYTDRQSKTHTDFEIILDDERNFMLYQTQSTLIEAPTANDNGKFMRAKDGVAVWEFIDIAEEAEV